MTYDKRKCVICGKTYQPRAHNQKTCSKSCRTIYMKKMKPIWNKKSYQKNKNKRKEYNKKNADKQKTYRKDYYQKNKDRIKQKTKDWCEKNKDRRRAYDRQYYNNNKTYLKDYRQQRRAKEIDKAFADYNKYLQTID